MKRMACIMILLLFIFLGHGIGEAAKKEKKPKKTAVNSEQNNEEPAKTQKKEVLPNYHVDEDLVIAAKDKSSTYGLRKYLGQEERNINSVDGKFKRCILSWAILSGNKENVDYILNINEKRKLNLNFDQKDIDGKSPRDYAKEKGMML